MSGFKPGTSSYIYTTSFAILRQNYLAENYGGYPTGLVVTYGLAVAVGVIVLGFLLSLVKWKTNAVQEKREVS
ncbi:hypothetical protein ACFW35_04245 [Fictibacillus sp. NPDC058756]|uniref:hypothetical protein n=1 Tax=Fictibacillus sp. NPDC058756 TaxID=3346625 RepID=UPI0036736EE8